MQRYRRWCAQHRRPPEPDPTHASGWWWPANLGGLWEELPGELWDMCPAYYSRLHEGPEQKTADRIMHLIDLSRREWLPRGALERLTRREWRLLRLADNAMRRIDGIEAEARAKALREEFSAKR